MLLLFVAVVTVVAVVQRSASRKYQKTRVKPENTWDFRVFVSGIALDAGDRRGTVTARPSLLLLVGLTLATVVGEPHCCSVVTLLTLATLFS